MFAVTAPFRRLLPARGRARGLRTNRGVSRHPGGRAAAWRANPQAYLVCHRFRNECGFAAVAWFPGAAATFYQLQAGSAPGLSNLATLILPASTLVFNTDGSARDVLRLNRRRQRGGHGFPSNEVTLTTAAVPPTAPSPPTATISGHSQSPLVSPPPRAALPADGGDRPCYRYRSSTSRRRRLVSAARLSGCRR